jgi:mono/diheme cytochrome c family protein
MNVRLGGLLLLAALWGSSCGERPQTGTSQHVGSGAADAQRQYIMKCAMCHGEQGEPVLLSAGDLRESTMGLEERIAIITYGKGTMPPHKDMLDAATIQGIATYIETFRP